MNPILYALIAYAMTAVISFTVIGLIVIVNNFMNRPKAANSIQEGEDI